MFAVFLSALLNSSLIDVPPAGDSTAKGPTIRMTEGTFEVVGIEAADLRQLGNVQWEPAQWSALLSVCVAAADVDTPLMAGTWRIIENTLRFEPRFPPVPGVRYRAAFDPGRLPGRPGGKSAPVTADFAIPKPATTPTIVEHVYPTRAKLPANQLKFYLVFSAPMSRGESYRHLHLLDDAGKEVEVPFLELGEELWDPDGMRFTLLFDPGRIKRGLKPHEESGPVLVAGKSYTFVIDRSWPDAHGNPLQESFRKKFSVLSQDDQPIDPKQWKLQPPTAGKAEPLTVTFPKPLDYALSQRLVWVVHADGSKVAGTVKLSDEETRWRFTPEHSWKAGIYRLVISTHLEDLAGNQVGKPFEIDVFKQVDREIKTATVDLPFRVP